MALMQKLPQESELFDFDFAAREEIGDGATVSSASVTQSNCAGVAALTIGAATCSGGIAQVRISGGIAGTTYNLRCDATTSAGDTLSMYAELFIESPPC